MPARPTPAAARSAHAVLQEVLTVVTVDGDIPANESPVAKLIAALEGRLHIVMV